VNLSFRAVRGISEIESTRTAGIPRTARNDRIKDVSQRHARAPLNPKCSCLNPSAFIRVIRGTNLVISLAFGVWLWGLKCSRKFLKILCGQLWFVESNLWASNLRKSGKSAPISLQASMKQLCTAERFTVYGFSSPPPVLEVFLPPPFFRDTIFYIIALVTWPLSGPCTFCRL